MLVSASAAAIDPGLATAGLIVGLLVGATGMGGGALMAPILIWLGIRPLAVVGSDLAYSTIMKLFGAAQHTRFGTVEWPTVRRLALGSVPGALVGVAILRQVKESQVDSVITHTLAFTLIVVAATLLLGAAFPRIRPGKVPSWGLTVAGFVVGTLVSVTSVGSGTLIVALLTLTTTLPARSVVGTDIVHALLLVAVAAAAHFQAGSIDVGLTANLLLGAIPGVLIGSRLGVRVPERALRPTLGVVLLVSGLTLL
jgi:uncharacterized membrane protein YfcA